MYYYYNPFWGPVFPSYLPREAHVGNQTAEFRGMYYYYNPFWGPLFPTYLPPLMPIHDPKRPSQTAEFIVSNDRTQTRFNGSLDVNGLVIEGHLSSYAQGEPLPATVFIPPTELSKIQTKPISEKEFELVDQDGKSTGYRITDYSVTKSSDGVYQEHTGTFIDPAGNESDFWVKTDPVPPVVLIVLIGATACATIIGIGAMTTNCNVTKATAIQDCLSKNLLPNVSVLITFGIRFAPFNMGCNYDCQVECKTPPIA